MKVTIITYTAISVERKVKSQCSYQDVKNTNKGIKEMRKTEIMKVFISRRRASQSQRVSLRSKIGCICKVGL